jgi:hypothetical protein
MQKIKSDTSKIRKWLPLIICVLSFSSCVLWIETPSHIEQIEDDEYVGKTLLIYPTAGKFVVDDSWYFGKRKGDSYFYSKHLDENSDLPPKIYKIVAKYQEYYHGFKRLLFGKYGITQYLIEPLVGKIDKRLFTFYVDTCEEQSDLTDPDTGIKIDFVCD